LSVLDRVIHRGPAIAGASPEGRSLALAVNLLGDWLRDALNPKLR
jgi:hypothetical protein